MIPRDYITTWRAQVPWVQAYMELADRFRPAFREVGRDGSFTDIINGKEYGVIEVPSWAWHRKRDEPSAVPC